MSQISPVAIVQARMNSTRLPGKVLLDLGGRTVLERVLRRLSRCKLLDKIVVATTSAAGDGKIVTECQRLGIEAFRGSEEDVLDRYQRTAESLQAKTLVRITSDCPLIDPEVVDKTIELFFDQRADYAGNGLERCFPRGLDTEVFTAQALSRAHREAKKPYEREHVTPYLYEHPETFKLASLTNIPDYSRYRWTLDTPDDLDMLRAMYERFHNHDGFSWREAIEIMEREPELARLNAGVVQKALHS